MNSGSVLAGNDGGTTMTKGVLPIARDRRDIAYEIEIEIPVERDVHRVGRDWHQDRVAVGFGLRDVFGGEVAAGARLVLDHELLTEAFRQMLPGKPRNDVRRAAGRERHDQTYRSRRIGLRPSDTRQGRRRDSARGQMQKLSSVRKFHFEPPFTSFDHLVGAHQH
jgi:hypothetical protein